MSMNSKSSDTSIQACPICCNYYLTEVVEMLDKRPTVICSNGHCVCMSCAKAIARDDDKKCPECRQKLLDPPIINIALIKAVEELRLRMKDIPKIPFEEINISQNAFAEGGFASVYKATWNLQRVAVKILNNLKTPKRVKDVVNYETNLTIGLHHPNIIRVFGTTSTTDGSLAIVMEYADRGSLQSHIGKLSKDRAVQISLGIIDGLDWVHSRKVAHRDLKPANILLFGPQYTPKIADFGLAKMIQSTTTNTSDGIGTFAYIAPELYERSAKYGVSVDIYSLTMILYEMFTGKSTEKEFGSTHFQIMKAVTTGVRPKLTDGFPENLKTLVERGWSAERLTRPKLDEFRQALLPMVPDTTPDFLRDDFVYISSESQSQEVNNKLFSLPVHSQKWNHVCEKLDSMAKRETMIENMKTESTFAKQFNSAVISVMRVVPRHLFVQVQGTDADAEPRAVRRAYVYDYPMLATDNSAEISPEIIAAELSLTDVQQGHFVLLVCINGGYYESVLAQLVGLHGKVFVVASESNEIKICKKRVDDYCPFASNVEWVYVKNCYDSREVVNEMNKRNIKFHTIICTNILNRFPEEYKSLLYTSADASILACVGRNGVIHHELFEHRREGKSKFKRITEHRFSAFAIEDLKEPFGRLALFYM